MIRCLAHVRTYLLVNNMWSPAGLKEELDFDSTLHLGTHSCAILPTSYRAHTSKFARCVCVCVCVHQQISFEHSSLKWLFEVERCCAVCTCIYLSSFSHTFVLSYPCMIEIFVVQQNIALLLPYPHMDSSEFCLDTSIGPNTVAISTERYGCHLNSA